MIPSRPKTVKRSIGSGLGLVLMLMALSPALLLAQSTNAFYQYPGTKRMAERLDKIARQSDPAQEPFLNARRAALFRSMLGRTDTNNLVRYYDLMTKLTTELLNCGQNDEALEQMHRIEMLLTSHGLL